MAWQEQKMALLACFLRGLTGVRCLWPHARASRRQSIYYANHTSHLDALLIWACLPRAARMRTRPVAAADYWNKSRMRRFFALEIFNAVLVPRPAEHFSREDAQRSLAPLHAALEQGDSLIFFPEGTRNKGEARLLPFKNGLHRLAQAHPDVDLVPVWLDNLNRVLPKGQWLPLPLLCSLIMGEALPPCATGEHHKLFLRRAAAALLDLAPSRAELSTS